MGAPALGAARAEATGVASARKRGVGAGGGSHRGADGPRCKTRAAAVRSRGLVACAAFMLESIRGTRSRVAVGRGARGCRAAAPASYVHGPSPPPPPIPASASSRPPCCTRSRPCRRAQAPAPLRGDVEARIDSLEPKVVAWRRAIHSTPSSATARSGRRRSSRTTCGRSASRRKRAYAHTGVVGCAEGRADLARDPAPRDMDGLPSGAETISLHDGRARLLQRRTACR